MERTRLAPRWSVPPHGIGERLRGPNSSPNESLAEQRRPALNRSPSMELRIDREAVAGARGLASAIVDPIAAFIARHSTVSVERAVARLCGVDGVDAEGIPLPNRLVDALPVRELGVARALGAAVAELSGALSENMLFFPSALQQGLSGASRRR